MAVYRIYTEKKPQYAVEAQSVLSDLRTALRLDVQGIRVLNRYDADRIDAEDFQKAIPTVFSEPAVDYVYEKLPLLSNQERIFAVEYLPGQFDQRADSAAQCIQLMTCKTRPDVRTARIYYIKGALTEEEKLRVRETLINPVEAREASLEKPATIRMEYPVPDLPSVLEDFTAMNAEQLQELRSSMGLAMDFADIEFLRDYFRDEEHRDPTVTEVRVIDTYWSDHCRHTTFNTILKDVSIEPEPIRSTYEDYLKRRDHRYGADTDRPAAL